MKFLIITNHSFMLWRFRRELISELMNMGEVVISTPFVGHEDDFEKMGCRCILTDVDRRGINPVKDLKLFRRYRRLLKEEKPDCVITYSIKPNIYAGFACRQLGIPYFVNVQGLGTAFQKKGISTLVTFMYKIALKKARTVFFENTVNSSEFISRKIIPENKAVVLKGAGVNLEDYALKPYPDESDGIHFLYLGRIMKEKGADELFAAARSLKSKYGDRVVFDIVGFFEDEYKEAVEKLVSDGVAVFHGFHADPKPFYESAHCVVLPSYHEGMSNVLLEAAATGRALIASDIPGCRESIDNGTTGLLCRKADAADLEKQLEFFISLSADKRAEMGKKGREKIEKEYDRKNTVNEASAVIYRGISL